MHVLMGIFAFIYIQTIVLAWIKNHRRLQDGYRFLLFLIFLLTASFGCINGLTEIIAVNAFSFLVTCETNETFCDTLLHRKGIPS